MYNINNNQKMFLLFYILPAILFYCCNTFDLFIYNNKKQLFTFI